MNAAHGVVLCGMVAASLSAQEWSHIDVRPDLWRSTSAWDSLRDRVVVANATGETFEHDGSSWRPIGALPEAWYSPRLAYQSHRGRTLALVYNGTANEFETYEYDGSSWRQRQPDHLPSLRPDAAMCYDSARQRVVLFGGGFGSTLLDDTWEWDGADWERRIVSVSPPPRNHAAMGFDPVRGVTVLVGGRSPVSFRDDHWEWDGTAWTQQNLSVRPPARSRGQIAHDAVRNRMVLYGGYTDAGGVGRFLAQPWEFDGQTWTAPTIGQLPSGRGEHSLVGVGSGVRIYGGTNPAASGGIEQRAQVFDYDGTAFTPLHGPLVYGTQLAYDPGRGRTVAVSSFASWAPTEPTRTFEWDGQVMIPRVLAGPPPRSSYGLADALAGEIVLFGGGSLASLHGDTWAYDGNAWTQKSTTGPSPRLAPAMATDPVRGVVVLFGGADQLSNPIGETWEWNGTAWNRQVLTEPTPRFSAGMAYDLNSTAIVMAGGYDSQSTGTAETWSYDGTAWTLLNNNAPGWQIAWWADIGRVALLAPSQVSSGSGLTYVLQGTTWWAGPSAPLASGFWDVAQDVDGNVLGVGSVTGLAASVLSAAPAQVNDHGSSCTRRAPQPRLVMRDLPRQGAQLRYEIIGAEPNQLAIYAASHLAGNVLVGGCRLALSNAMIVGIGSTNGAGQSRLSITIPNTSAVRGVNLFVQAGAGEYAGPIGGVLGLTAAKWIQVGF
ncbi:MAG: hypothetical protein NXI31_07770 [bacterium]|nr:hypothetical protein [bacterium]